MSREPVRILIGSHAVKQVLEQNRQIVLKLFFDKDRGDPRIQSLIQLATEKKIQIIPLSREKLSVLVGSDKHQGIAAEIESVSYSEQDIFLLIEQNQSALIVILDCIQDPHNLGACMRSAAALGATALVCPEDRACLLNATVSKVASGAAEQLPFLAVKNLARFMSQLKEKGVWCVGLSLDTDVLLSQIDLRGPIALVMGNEENGLRSLTEKNCDYLAKIPMPGNIESLNVSVATGISLYEIYRQRFLS